MPRSTFLRADVPRHLAAAPHVGMPLVVPGDAYPYTRRHAPSSTLHSNLEELCRWMQAHLDGPGARLDAELLDLLWRPVVRVGRPPWEEAAALGWAVGSYGGHRTLSHSGMDPGFGSMLVLVPEQRTGVVVLANANTAHVWTVAKAALDVTLAHPRAVPGTVGEGVRTLRTLLPPVVGPVAAALTTSGPDEATTLFHRLATADPSEHDLDDDGFVDAVWGAIELHRTDLVWPVLRLWTELRPESSEAWTMTGWAHQVDGDPDLARRHLERALELDPGNDEAAQIMAGLPSA